MINLNLRRTMRRISVLFLMGLLLTAGCQAKLEPIHFGHDQCHACKMNIVDKQHASQLVTSKGKQFKFDSIECLLESIHNEKFENTAFLKVAEFGKSQMIDAKTAHYLITPQIRTPMGANLSAFASVKDVKDAQKQYKGEIYQWNELPAALKKKD